MQANGRNALRAKGRCWESAEHRLLETSDRCFQITCTREVTVSRRRPIRPWRGLGLPACSTEVVEDAASNSTGSDRTWRSGKGKSRAPRRQLNESERDARRLARASSRKSLCGRSFCWYSGIIQKLRQSPEQLKEVVLDFRELPWPHRPRRQSWHSARIRHLQAPKPISTHARASPRTRIKLWIRPRIDPPQPSGVYRLRCGLSGTSSAIRLITFAGLGANPRSTAQTEILIWILRITKCKPTRFRLFLISVCIFARRPSFARV